MVSDRATTADLVAPYNPDPPTTPATDAVLTMCASTSCSIMIGRKVRCPWATPIRLTPIIQDQSSSVLSQHGRPPAATPALLHKTCTAPYFSSVSAANAATSDGSDTSVTTACTSPPPARNSAAVDPSA